MTAGPSTMQQEKAVSLPFGDESQHQAMASAVYLPVPDERLPLFVPHDFVLPDAAFMAALEWLDLEEMGHVHLGGKGLLTKNEAGRALRWLHIENEDLFEREVDRFQHDLTWEDLKLLWARMGQAKRKLTQAERIYVMFDNPGCCTIAKYMSNFIMLCIFASTASMVLESQPTMQSQPCPTCEPVVSAPSLAFIEVFSIMVFTCEYLTRLVRHSSHFHSLIR
jgi:hypothetical protein